MIVSHEYKFIFIKTRKVGGTSLEIALSKFCGRKDIITEISPPDEMVRRRLGYRGPQNHKLPYSLWAAKDWLRFVGTGRRPRFFYNHMPACEVRKWIGDEVWNNYTKFSIVRNPYDFAVSAYFWKKKINQIKDDISFTDFLRENAGFLQSNRRTYEIDGKSAVDYLVRYEDLRAGLTEVSEVIGLPENLFGVMSGLRSKSGARPSDVSATQLFFDNPGAKELIELLCETEIRANGYSLGDFPPSR